jgi:hypothetical protein
MIEAEALDILAAKTPTPRRNARAGWVVKTDLQTRSRRIPEGAQPAHQLASLLWRTRATNAP